MVACCSRIITITFSLLLLASCGGRSERAAMLDKADSLMSVSPSLALGYTDSLLNTGWGSDHWRAQLQMRRLNAKNKLDTVFNSRHVDEAKHIVEHFDRSGTPNERMLAHYLLGRTYADTHEAPMALEAYQDAVDCADTTAADCDYRQLCFVYTQMAAVLYNQNLYRDELECLDHAIDYGYRASDTLNALLAYTQKTGAYSMLLRPDSVLFVSETVSELFRRSGYKNLSAAVLFSPIRHLINIGELNKARKFLDSYEHESGYFDTNSNIERGREIYYYTKGTFHVAVHQYDSAEYYFRKELRDGRDFNNQNAGARGLAQLFMITHQPDSAAKYALYSYAMNDSTYDHETTSEVAKVKTLYDYSRYQREAQTEKIRANQNALKLTIVVFVLIVIMSVASLLLYLYWKQRKKKTELQQLYNGLLERLKTEQDELIKMNNDRSELLSQIGNNIKNDSTVNSKIDIGSGLETQHDYFARHLQHLESAISKKQSEVTLLAARTAQLQLTEEQLKTTIDKEKTILYHRDEYKHLVHLTDKGKCLEAEDWKAIEQLVKECLPGFFDFMKEQYPLLSIAEYRICLLRRLHIKPRAISFAIKKDPSDITHIRQMLNVKLFGVSGNSKEFDKLLWGIGSLIPPISQPNPS
jgi:hypothetical protein